MITVDLKSVAMRAKEVAIAIYGTCGSEHFDTIQIDDDGNLSVSFSYGFYGCIDYETIYLTEQDMTDPIEETVARHKKKKQEEIDRINEAVLENERKRKLEQVRSERIIYEKLKAKFESSETK